ncbi:kunitz-type protease inhibitor 4 [Peromyscus californicus insignis]|uniref:kunitz-type protease inhibitor 4 n=1 Tax=Peromyscus californicus insignis TaxID=564181 RepID=UPI0022A69E76|nr:kunitz-type protease inhibitor 4 [Peromyscus californicus insignis]
MKPAKLGVLLAFFIFCSLTTPGLSGIAKLMKLLCDEYRDICTMDMDPGHCYEPQFKFFYNRTAKECQSFIFNGCDGNLNNFNLKLECDIACNEDYRTVR